MTPSENQRNFIYATAIINTARPMTRADFECSECGREKVNQSAPELRRPFMVSPHEALLAESVKEQLRDDVTQIIQRVPFIECAPFRLFDAGLISDLADASDRLAATIAKLQEKANANG
jgi:hypothetical protein